MTSRRSDDRLQFESAHRPDADRDALAASGLIRAGVHTARCRIRNNSKRSLVPLAKHTTSDQSMHEQVARAGLGRGESEAVSLALELNRATVILDERAGRRLPGELGVPITGTLGILLEARRRGVIASLRPHLQALIDVRFYLTPGLVRELLTEVGET